MNIFVIPSWYPTEAFPSTGIFYKEQVRLLAKERQDWSIGVSLWGSHEPKLWLKASRPLHSLIQYASKFPVRPFDRQPEPNLAEFFTPAYTWSRKLLKGNIHGIIKANERNLGRYRKIYGEPEVIHAHIAYPAGYIAMELSRVYNIPFVITEQMSPFPLPSFQADFKKCLLPPLKQAGAVLSVGPNLAEELNRYAIHSIPTSNFIDLESFKVKKTGNERPVLLALGRLEHQKGFDLLINAVALHNDKTWKLRIGGSGSQEAKLKQMVAKRGLEDQVEFLGELSQERVADQMQACDFFVLSSRHESFGIVLIEAMACGKPVVYTRCGGITGSLPPFAGVACEVSADVLSQAIGQMLYTYHEYDTHRISNYVASNYSVSAVAPQLEKIYRSVAGLS